MVLDVVACSALEASRAESGMCLVGGLKVTLASESDSVPDKADGTVGDFCTFKKGTYVQIRGRICQTKDGGIPHREGALPSVIGRRTGCVAGELALDLCSGRWGGHWGGLALLYLGGWSGEDVVVVGWHCDGRHGE